MAGICLLVQASLSQALELRVFPSERLVTEPASISVSDVPPGAEVTIEASMQDRGGRTWSSRGVYYADLNGNVNVDANASLDGTYLGVNGEGLFWSMLPITHSELDRFDGVARDQSAWPRWPDFDSWNAGYDLRSTPVEIAFTARITGALAADNASSASAVQKVAFIAKNVSRIEVAEGDLRGVLYEAPGQGPHPLAMFVTGSGGGAYEGKAALLASYGITSFALAHFNYPGRPDQLVNMPLEYFRDAIDWFASRYGQRRVAILGDSRGGEGVLLIASTFPDRVSAVVAGVPSNMVFEGCCSSDGSPAPAWTLAGEPLPFVPWKITDTRESDIWKKSNEARDIYRAAMASTAMDDPRWIPVEKMQSPLLLVSGDADAIWPSNLASERVVARLREKGFTYPYRHLAYPGGGHAVTFPMLVKSLADQTGPGGLGFSLTVGGTPEGNAFAQSDAFRQILEFVKMNEEASD